METEILNKVVSIAKKHFKKSKINLIKRYLQAYFPFESFLSKAQKL